jgi:hypothetical protein
MSGPLTALLIRYQQLSTRERLMLGVAAFAMVYFLLDLLLVTPQLEKRSALATQAEQQRIEQEALVLVLKNQTTAQDNALLRARDERDALAVTVAQGEQLLSDARGRPQVGPLLRRLVSDSPGLFLTGLRTLPSTVFFQPKSPASPPPAASGTPAELPPAPQLDIPALHVKTVETSIQGNYLDLLRYMSMLRDHPQRLYWDSASITVSSYPQASLRLVQKMLTTEADNPSRAAP